MRRTLGEQIAVDTDLPSVAAQIEIDPGQLDQVLVNLAVNARDAMPEGGTLRFSVTVDREGDGEPEHGDGGDHGGQAPRRVRLEVRDTGMGMSETVLEQAFEPFFSTKSRETGSGLGLATVYGIVARSGGEIAIKSRTGLGTTVTIDWPYCGGEVAPVSPADAPPLPPAAGELVLVVEDEPSLRKLIEQMLTDGGYRAIGAGGAEQAIGVALEQEIDLLLSDIVMPGAPGPQLAESLQEMRPELPVLLMSGYSEHTDAVRERWPLIEKPFTAGQLLRAVASALEQGAVRPEVRR
jgi:two-component system, cell cycle sensor histidine kinase and response regulator CckA